MPPPMPGSQHTLKPCWCWLYHHPKSQKRLKSHSLLSTVFQELRDACVHTGTKSCKGRGSSQRGQHDRAAVGPGSVRRHRMTCRTLSPSSGTSRNSGAGNQQRVDFLLPCGMRAPTNEGVTLRAGGLEALWVTGAQGSLSAPLGQKTGQQPLPDLE